jgi:hypothetical protein
LSRAIRSAHIDFHYNGEVLVAKPNYAFAKRQRELVKKQKKEAKQKERAAEKAPVEGAPDAPDAPVTPPSETPGG